MPTTPMRFERTVQLPPDSPERTQQTPRSPPSTLRSDSLASCASTARFSGGEQSPRTPSKGALTASGVVVSAPTAATAASADLAADDVGAGFEKMDPADGLPRMDPAEKMDPADGLPRMDPAEREYLLRLLFERFCSHGKDRERASPHKQLALRSFGPARHGTLVHTLSEDVRLFEGRLGAKCRSRPFVFSGFAATPRRDASEPQLDSVHFAKLCRECVPSAQTASAGPSALAPPRPQPSARPTNASAPLSPHQVWHSRRPRRRR